MRKSILLICQVKRESNEKSVLIGKLLQMLTTRSAKNEERAAMLFVQFIQVTPGSMCLWISSLEILL